MQKLLTRLALVAALAFLVADAARTTDLGHSGSSVNAGRSRQGGSSNRHQSTSDQSPRNELSILQQTMLRTSYVNCTNETSLLQQPLALGGAIMTSFFAVVHGFFVIILSCWGHILGNPSDHKIWRKHANQTLLCAVLGLCSAVTMLAFYWSGYNCWAYNPIPLFGPGAGVTPNELWELICLAIAIGFISIVLRLFAQEAEEPGAFTAAFGFGLITAGSYVFAALVGLGNGVNAWFGSAAAVLVAILCFQYFEGIFQVFKKYPTKRFMNAEFVGYVFYALAGVGLLITYCCGPLVANVNEVSVSYISDFYLTGYLIAAFVPFLLILSWMVNHRDMRVKMAVTKASAAVSATGKRSN